MIDAVILPKGQLGVVMNADASCSPAPLDTSAAVCFDIFEEAGRRRPLPGEATGEGHAGQVRRRKSVQGDCLDEASLDRALRRRALGVLPGAFHGGRVADSRTWTVAPPATSAVPPRAPACGASSILADLADDVASLSAHLKSRAETGEVLRASGVPVIEFRASIVIGAGSLSFEMIQALVERLPVMVCPRWVADAHAADRRSTMWSRTWRRRSICPTSRGRVFEIGGPEVVSYGDMMREYARLRGLRRLLLPVPVLTPHLSGLWLALVTPAQARVGRALVEGLKNATVVRSPAARETFPIEPMPLRGAFTKAIDDGAARAWKVDTREVVVDVPPAQAFAPVRRIGGATGWYFGNLLWKMRGWLDRLFGGVGMSRGRRDPDCCIVGDVIDGWTVVAYEPDRLHASCRGHEAARSRLAGVRGDAARWREALDDPADGHLRSARPARPVLLVRDYSDPCADVRRPPAADRTAC